MTLKLTKLIVILAVLTALSQSAIRADIIPKVPVIFFVIKKGFADSFQT